jgi:hypothetical protein
VIFHYFTALQRIEDEAEPRVVGSHYPTDSQFWSGVQFLDICVQAVEQTSQELQLKQL